MFMFRISMTMLEKALNLILAVKEDTLAVVALRACLGLSVNPNTFLKGITLGDNSKLSL